MEGIQIGNITKQWSGLVREMFTDADSFSINFPMDLAVELKAILLGACILIVIDISFDLVRSFLLSCNCIDWIVFVFCFVSGCNVL